MGFGDPRNSPLSPSIPKCELKFLVQYLGNEGLLLWEDFLEEVQLAILAKLQFD
jgi:hypothetical protein